MFKVIVVCSLVVFASAGVLPEQYEEHGPAQYDFSYSVHDAHTGDVKQQQESRRGDVVQGSYSLIEPDGNKRIVHYSADEHSGFNAVVQREGTVHQQTAQIAHAPVAVAHSAPIVQAAPVYQAQYQAVHAPVVHAAPALAVSHGPVAVAHAAPAVQISHGPAYAVSHGPALQVSHAAPVAIAHSSPALISHSNAISTQSYSHAAPVIAQQAYTTQPQIVSHQIAAPAYQTIQPLGYASQGYATNAYANNGYANNGYISNGYANNGYGQGAGYATVSQVTQHGGYHQ